GDPTVEAGRSTVHGTANERTDRVRRILSRPSISTGSIGANDLQRSGPIHRAGGGPERPRVFQVCVSRSECQGGGNLHVRAGPRLAGALFLQRIRSEEHTSELQSRRDIVCRLLLEKKK